MFILDTVVDSNVKSTIDKLQGQNVEQLIGRH